MFNHKNDLQMSNIEIQNPTNEKSIGGVLGYLINHPFDAVVLSALLRSPIFLVAYRKEGLALAFGAAFAQFFFRTIFGGINGAIIQAFSKVEPAWHAILTVPLVLACFSHLVEFIVQSVYDNYTGTTSMGKAIVASVIISIISAVFNLFAMRRGTMLVKDENSQSLWKDFKSFPRITYEFILLPPRKIWQMFHQGENLKAILATIFTSLSAGLTAGILRNSFWAVVIGFSVLVLLIIGVSVFSIINSRKIRQIEVISEQ
jgi:hypothetical protein